MAACEKIVQRTTKNATESRDKLPESMVNGFWKAGEVFATGKVTACAFTVPPMTIGGAASADVDQDTSIVITRAVIYNSAYGACC